LIAAACRRYRPRQPGSYRRLARPPLVAGLPTYRNGRVESALASYLLVENSIKIAWDYLERTGELGNPEVAARVLLDTIVIMMRRGEWRRLLLSNKAIYAYKRFRAERLVTLRNGMTPKRPRLRVFHRLTSRGLVIVQCYVLNTTYETSECA
jgi:hypothetical protein